ncbi:MAG: UDP-N-acetylmuramoyl-L-alanyl-D-glutamate--2,6-d iaminopimelate ligase [Deltaproteobacteria bacterium]|nr:UDP-N-acetylmuramoyl-L-alanyl-D-glutamate--2,6-d iaminopimelate ligase [Deltaproteobacteria bacterium]
MKLRDLVSRLPDKVVLGDPLVEVTGLAYHSREVKEGDLFAALRGMRADGKQFIPEACDRGARSLLIEEPAEGCGATQVVVPRARAALACVASAFFGDPSLFLTVIGITGTNGKTTTSYLLESILSEAGEKVGVVGTVNYRYAGQVRPAATTTPESLDLQKLLADMREAGMTHAVLEVSSHALDMQRVKACHFDVALFTNLTRDHLDYHGSMEKYFQAKKILFTESLQESRKKNRFSVINTDDPWGEELCRSASGKILRYGVKSRGEIYPKQFSGDLDGIRAEIVTPRGLLEIASPLIGLHNLSNILAAITVAEALEILPEITARGLEKMARVPGRLDRVPGGKGVRIFVDYAHTPDALERALETLRSARPERLLVIFGCGGDRDRGKRPVMGKTAVLGSDWAVITSDNPRTEEPLKIMAEIEAGIRETGRPRLTPEDLSAGDGQGGYLVIPDRREAISRTIGAARPGDVVLIAGKGHEDYQILGTSKIHFDDREEALAALQARREKRDL